jgi:hypothetical protein
VFQLRRMRQISLFASLTFVAGIVQGEVPKWVSHPIQKLLLAYAASVPPEAALVSAAKHPGATEALAALLATTDGREAWPSAVIALGIISGPNESKELFSKLSAFMWGSHSYGCVDDAACKAVEGDSVTLRWDREARLSVPIAEGYILRNLSSSPGDLPFIAGLASKLVELATFSNVGSHIQVCRSLDDVSGRSCVLELQLNAVRALRIADTHDAKIGLHRILAQGDKGSGVNPLVVQEARNALIGAPSLH